MDAYDSLCEMIDELLRRQDEDREWEEHVSRTFTIKIYLFYRIKTLMENANEHVNVVRKQSPLAALAHDDKLQSGLTDYYDALRRYTD